MLQLQIPIPGGETWIQFPIVAVIVLCFLLAGSFVFAFTRWAVNVYRTERDKDLEWREKQNQQREAAVAEQNRQWRQAMAARDIRYEQLDRERESKVTDLANMLEKIATILQTHDAKTDAAMVVMQERTRPRPKGQP
jgi:hypothetical protein